MQCICPHSFWQRLILHPEILRNIDFKSFIFKQISLYFWIFRPNSKICTHKYKILTRPLICYWHDKKARPVPDSLHFVSDLCSEFQKSLFFCWMMFHTQLNPQQELYITILTGGHPKGAEFNRRTTPNKMMNHVQM